MSNVLLRINNLKKVYHTAHGTFEALKGVSLDIYEGEVISLLGVNGAGKTTLSSIIATLIPPTNGDVSFNDKSIYHFDNLYKYRSIVGFCPQKSNLNPEISLQDNLIYAGRFYGLSKEEARQKAKNLMNDFDLTKYAQESAEILSGGYRQRFLIARALMNNPKLVILDEPTVALDPHIRRLIWQKIKELKQQGISVLLTTHYIEEAELLSDRVCIMDSGLIKLIDTPQNLVADFKKGDLEEVFLQLLNEQNR